VCDERCEYMDDQSTSETAVCKLPPLPTTYASESFGIGEEKDDLRPRAIFGTLKDNQMAFDDILVSTPKEGDQVDGECFIGFSYKEDHVGLLQRVKWFMKDIEDKSLYADEAVF
jgi:hypothetical protein